MGGRLGAGHFIALTAIAALVAACAAQPAPVASSPAAPSEMPIVGPSPTPVRQIVRGVFVLDLNTVGPRCEPVLLQIRHDRLRLIGYTVHLVGDWRKEMVDRAFEWTSPSGATMREGDLVEMQGIVEADDFCNRGAPVLSVDALIPVVPAGAGTLTVTAGHPQYMCIEGCAQWIRIIRGGDVIGQAAIRVDRPSVWHLDPGPYDVVAFESYCNVDGSCTYQRGGQVCVAAVTLPDDGDHRLVLTLPEPPGGDVLPACGAVFDP